MEDPQLLPKLQQQNALLKKAVLQEQQRRVEADGALEQSRSEGAALRARVDELSELLASIASSQPPHASGGAATGGQGGGPGWLRSLGWKGAGNGRGGGGVVGAPEHGELAMLREELRAKAEENERLHMQLFERNQELLAVRDDLHAARAELERRAAGERGMAPVPRDLVLSRQREQERQALQQFWDSADRLVAAAERSALDAQSAMEAARVSCGLARWCQEAALMNGDPAPRRSALLQEAAFEPPAPAPTDSGGGAHAAKTSGEAPWWASGGGAARAGGLLEAVVPLLRQLMVNYNVHHCAIRERLERFHALEGALAPTPCHARAARQLCEATERHDSSIAALHTSATSLRAALRTQGAKSARRAGLAGAPHGDGAGEPGSKDGGSSDKMVEAEAEAARAQTALLQGALRMKGVLRQVVLTHVWVSVWVRVCQCVRVVVWVQVGIGVGGCRCVCLRDTRAEYALGLGLRF